MKASIGTRLREQRERQQVDLTAIAARTKIKAALLEALENDEVASWPKGIFGRAYLRDYARAIGLEPEPLVREFYELHPDPIAPVPPHPDPLEEAAAASTPFRRFVTSAFSVVPGLLRSSKADASMTAIAAAATHPRMTHDEAVADDFDVLPGVRHAASGHAADEELAAEIAIAPVDVTRELAIDEELGYAGEPDVSGSFESFSLEPLVAEPIEPEPPPAIAAADTVTLATAAHLCTRLARASDWRDVDVALGGAARALDAVGLIVWAWDPRGNVLRPSLAQGYPPAVLARLPAVRIDEDHALAAAFRSVDTRIVDGSFDAHGAVVVPLIAARGCVGVFALELRGGRERDEAVRAFAALLAAQLVTLVDVTAVAEAVSA
jgi:hypothetical protein